MSARHEDDLPRRGALSREEILSGSWHRAQRASRVLRAIELRVAYMRAASRRVIRQYFLGDEEAVERRFDPDYLQGIRHSVRSADPVTIGDLERYAAYWKALVPDDADLRAAVAELLTRRYPLDGRTLRGVRDALGLQAEVSDDRAAVDDAAPEDGASSRSAPPLPPTDEQLLQDVEANLTWIPLPGGATLFHQGEVTDSLFLVISGRLRVVFVEGDGTERVLADIGRDEQDGEVLVDGGLMNNFPLDIMRQRCPDGTVLGVSVSVARESGESYQFGASVSGWEVLVGKTGLFRQSVRAPSLFTTLLRSVELGSTHRMKSDAFLDLADLVIRPPVEHIGLLNFSSYREGIEIGYRAAQEALAHVQSFEQLAK